MGHYDHVGYGRNSNSNGPIGQIHNGADDNASGVAGVMETAEAFTHLPQPPRRSVIFALWDGEEAGLLGSKYWIDHSTVPLKQVAAAANVDMIGRSQRPSDHLRRPFRLRLAEMLSRDNEPLGLLLDFDWLMKADSDHHPFFAAGLPIIMLHTGLHDDYHRPSDKAEKVNPAGLQKVSQLLFRTVLDLADADSRPKFRPASRGENAGDRANLEHILPPLPGRLGLGWDEKLAKDGIVQLVLVNPGSPAAKAGLRVGDRITHYAGRPISDDEQFRRLVLADLARCRAADHRGRRQRFSGSWHRRRRTARGRSWTSSRRAPNRPQKISRMAPAPMRAATRTTGLMATSTGSRTGRAAGGCPALELLGEARAGRRSA